MIDAAYRAKLQETAEALGVSPVDLATVISYETGGTFDPAQAGPRTKHGQHRGLIQFGEPQAAQYGVDWSDPLNSQLGADGAVVRYLTDRGFKKGGSLLDLYSTINAGAPGLYDRSDETAGGMPGTVRDKVETQFADHRKRAEEMFQVADNTLMDRSELLAEAVRRGLIDRSALKEEARRRGLIPGGASEAGAEAQQAADRQAMSHPAGPEYSPGELAARRRDEMVYRAHPFASAVATAAQGIPFVGEGLDELAGIAGGDMAKEAVRAGRRGFANANPELVMPVQLAGGALTAGPIAAGVAPILTAAMPAGLAQQALVGAAAGAGGGALEGGVSGYLAGEGEGRAKEALNRATLGGGAGLVLGAGAPVLSGAGRNLARALPTHSARRQAQNLGVSLPSAEITGRMLVNDDPAEIARQLAEAGPGAMLADAGPATAGLLDASIQKAGPAGAIARRAIGERAAEAGQDVAAALDQYLGKPKGIKEAGRDVAQRSQAGRKRAYDRAFATPIDYASPQGMRVEEVLSRIPPKEMKAAIEEANAEMLSEGVKNQQIMAEIADDGTVTFREMPNVQQLDALKRALDKAGSGEDMWGRPLATSLRPRRLAKELRKALGDAVVDANGVRTYDRAVAMGGQKIAEDNALKTGRRILDQNMTAEDVADQLDGAAPELIKQAKVGIRAAFENVMANVKRVASDGNMDAREGLAALKALSSRAVREKMRAVLGNAEADALADRAERAWKAFELKARTADNSKTFARLSMDEAIKEYTDPGFIGELLSGSPVASTKKLVQTMTQMTPEARRQVEERITGEIATLLTQARGPQAERNARILIGILQRQPVTEEMAKKVGRATGLLVGAGGYQSTLPLRDNR